PDELVLTAAALGHQAIAITDRNSVAGLVRAHHAAKTVGIRLVVGVRLDLDDGTSLLAYPQDRAAYGRLARLLTLGKRRAPKGECHIGYADVVAHGEGQIVVALPPEAGDVAALAARIAADLASTNGATNTPRRRSPPVSRRSNISPNWPGPAPPSGLPRNPLRPSGGRGRGPSRSDGRVRWAARPSRRALRALLRMTRLS